MLSVVHVGGIFRVDEEVGLGAMKTESEPEQSGAARIEPFLTESLEGISV